MQRNLGWRTPDFDSEGWVHKGHSTRIGRALCPPPLIAWQVWAPACLRSRSQVCSWEKVLKSPTETLVGKVLPHLKNGNNLKRSIGCPRKALINNILGPASADKRVCFQAGQPEFSLPTPHGKRREPTPAGCSLGLTYTPWLCVTPPI